MNYLYLIILITIMAFWPITTSDPCPVSTPCVCQGNNIRCDGLGLKAIPKFRKTNVTFEGWNLFIGNNSISVIPSEAFVNITLTLLSIPQSALTYIADDAFLGSEHDLYTLYLANNNLTDVPAALGKLTRLNSLYLQYNPMKTLPKDIMINLSNSLQFLSIGSVFMTKWPSEIRHLIRLKVGTFYNLPLDDLPDDAFHGFEDAKVVMDFISPNFKGIPKALRVLNKMTELDIRKDLRIISDNINKDSFKGMTSLHTLWIDNCNITEVPDLSELHNLSSLQLTNCPISQWNKGKPISVNSVVLDNTEITEIPRIITELKNVSFLSFFQTKITEIKADDLMGLTNLKQLSLSHSPVRNISNDAFRDNKAIGILSLDSLKITGFPKAIKSISSLKFLDLTNNTIECTCSAMGWLKGWSGINYTYVSGECQNNKTQINEFIQKELEKC